MGDHSLLVIAGALLFLIIASGYFSSTETSMMALNRYRLRHLADQGHGGARRALQLLQRPDRLIGFILLGNNFVNILLTQIATIATLQLFGERGLLPATIILTAVMLVFAEILPKTFAALHPERIAFPSSLLLRSLMAVFHPVILLMNGLTTGLLRLLGVEANPVAADPLDREELRTVVKEAGAMIPHKHREMLFGILDLDRGTIEDIMVPRSEIVAIDLEANWVDILDQITGCRHTRVPCYRGSLDDTVGILHMRNLARMLHGNTELGVKQLETLLTEPYYVPLKTDLHTQLIHFQVKRQRAALVVNEYGDIEGLVTIDDLLEEVVGEFTTVPQFAMRDVRAEEDGSFLVDGSANIRALNRTYGWRLPEEGPKTLNGLILAQLEHIPETGISMRIAGYTIEILHSTEQTVRSTRIFVPQDTNSEDENAHDDDASPDIERGRGRHRVLD